jgi:hypothetical protein
VVAVVLLASGLLAAPGARSDAPSTTGPGSTRIDVTTANVRTGIGGRRARLDVARAARRATIVAAQEMWHRRPGEVAPPGWRGFQPTGPIGACRGNMTLWRRDVWRRGNAYAYVLNRSTLFPYAPTCATVVILRNRATGLVVPIVNVHLIPHVEVAGRPRNLPARIALYRHDMDRVARRATLIAARRGRVIVGGDWNVDYSADRRVRFSAFPYAHLWRRFDTHWAKLAPTGPTHGSRRIDALWWSEAGGFRPVDSDTIRHTYSDHNFVRLTLTAR